uniref:Uncharacterized protein n=1 Tax=Mesocestoides corti TaxID=53468 RepID=A0A5K3FZ92_MESCO
YNRTGFIDESQATTTSQAPSIRVDPAGNAAQYILLLIHVYLWSAAYLTRMPLKHRGTRDWLRPAWQNTSAPSDVATVATLEPQYEENCLTKQALSTNHKPEAQFKRRPSESTMLATPLIKYRSSFVSFSGWLHFSVSSILN